MKNALYIILLSSLIFTQDNIGGTLYLDDLINFLQNNYTTNNVLSYNAARDILYGEVDKINGQVKGIYTNFTVTLPENVDPSTHLYENGIDCEHLWPQSMGASSSPMKSDMHHLRPCKSTVNSSRGNKPFNEINDYQTDNWYWLSNNSSSIPSNNIDEYSESKSGNFEPREDRKGDIARAIFYFYTIYNNVADDNFFQIQKNILYQWHVQDQVDSNELQRTWTIASYQNNIPNPFIVDPSLVERAYFYEFLLGDSNQDNIINIVDVVLMVGYILGDENLSNNQFINSDLDDNSIVNVNDIILILEIILS
jgi:hypothetical protein